MKRVSLLILAIGIAASSVNAKSIDMKLVQYMGVDGEDPVLMKNGDAIFINGGKKGKHPEYVFGYGLTWMGTDSIMMDDKIMLKMFVDPDNPIPLMRTKGSVITLNEEIRWDAQAIELEPFADTKTSGTVTIQWCDSLWMENAAGSVIPDPNMANNHPCIQIKLTTWLAGIEGIDAFPDQIVLYPNPASQKLTLKYNFEAFAASANIVITDVAGKTVHTQELGTNLSGTKDIALNIAHLNSGLFFVRLTTAEGKTALSKFVLQ